MSKKIKSFTSSCCCGQKQCLCVSSVYCVFLTRHQWFICTARLFEQSLALGFFSCPINFYVNRCIWKSNVFHNFVSFTVHDSHEGTWNHSLLKEQQTSIKNPTVMSYKHTCTSTQAASHPFLPDRQEPSCI